jgi:hypothetical protein
VLRNFSSMPSLLKLLVASSLVMGGFLVRSVLPYGSISAFGRMVSIREWWTSGAGAATTIIAVLFMAAAILMLRRSQYGRSVYVLGWVAMSISIPTMSSILNGGGDWSDSFSDGESTCHDANSSLSFYECASKKVLCSKHESALT